MKKKLAKLLALVLALTMLTGLMTVTAFADDYDDAEAVSETLGVWVGITEVEDEISYEASSVAEPAATKYVTADGFEYTLDTNNKATITGYKGNLTSITIPAKVNGYTVVEVYSIRGDAITNITVSEGIERISGFSFYRNNSLRTISIPSTVTDISQGFCRLDPNLQSVNVNSANANYKSVDGILFSKDGKKLICYPGGKTATSYTIPSTVETLDYYAFSYADSLVNVTIPTSVSYIRNHVFEYCTSIVNMVVPEGVERLAYGVFDHCTSMQTISLPSTLDSLVTDFLSYCTGLQSISVSDDNPWLLAVDGVLYGMPTSEKLTLLTYPYGKNATYFNVPDGVEVIGNCSFLACPYLKSVNLPNTVTAIESYAFSESVLQDITIPKACVSVGNSAFYKTTGLTDIYYRGTEAQKSGITINSYNDPFKNATWHYNCSDEFADVCTTDWFYGNVKFVKEAGIMTGQGGTNKFAPAQSLQRQEFANILWRLAGEPSATYVAKFPDVPDGTWFTTPIMWAYKNGVITGYASGNFGVGDNVTREQFATMLYRYAKEVAGIQITGSVDISSYPDAANVSPWALDAMKWAVGNGIITGKGGVYLDPAGNASRCEGAAMIERYMKKFMQN